MNEINVGDRFFRPTRERGFHTPYLPRHELYQVTRVTKAQFEVSGSRGRLMFWKKDLSPVGGSHFDRLQPATAEIIDQYAQEMGAYNRYRIHMKALGSLLARPVHTLRLTLEEAEKLAAVWKELRPQGDEGGV